MGELLLTELVLSHPALPLLVGAALVGVLPRRAGGVVMLAAPLVALAQIATTELGTSAGFDWLGIELQVLRADGLSRPFALVFAVAALIAGTYGLASQTRSERVAALAYAGAALGIVHSGDLLTLFVFWEMKAVASSFVVLTRGTRRAGRSGMRCLFAQIVGGKLLLLGAIWHATDTGSLAFDAFEMGAPAAFILAGFLVSAAAPVLHAWLPDAYPEAGVAGTVFLSAFTTKAAVYALARGFPGLELLIYLGVAMAVIGVVYAMLENDIRRLLSYHIISQVGFMVTGIGVGTELAINGAVAHAVAHILYKGLLLMGAGAVLAATGRRTLHQLGGLARRLPLVLTLYLVGALSISSMPLLSGFVSKEMVTYATSHAGFTWAYLTLSIVAVGTFLSTGCKLPFAAWIGQRGLGPATNDGAEVRVGRLPRSMYVAMIAAAVLNLAIGVAPGMLYELLPYAADFDPFPIGRINEKVQLLAFTAAAFWFLRRRLAPKDTVSLDVDVLYRRVPAAIRSRLAAWDRRRTPVSAAATAGADARGERGGRVAVAPRVVRRAGTLSTTTTTWMMGAVFLGVCVLLLAVSLVTS